MSCRYYVISIFYFILFYFDGDGGCDNFLKYFKPYGKYSKLLVCL